MCSVNGIGGNSGTVGDCSPSSSAADRVGEVARSDDLQEIVEFDQQHPELHQQLEDALIAQRNYDGFHALSTGVTDRGAIDWAQEVTANGGCASLIDKPYFLCNPGGPEIGEFTIPKIQEMPGIMSPALPDWHTYHAQATSPDRDPSLAAAATAVLVSDPTPGDDAPATSAGTLNDAGILGANMLSLDMVRSYVSRDVNGNPVVANVTVPGDHVLTPGIVSQGVRRDENGTHLTVVGEGNAWYSNFPGVNAVAELTFQNKIDANLRQATWLDAQRP